MFLALLRPAAETSPAFEINPIIANTIMKDRYANLSNRLYFRSDVHIYIEDGRSYIRRSASKYQVIQATLVDTWASTAAGAFALSENSLYTTEAFEDYLSHLTDDGIVSFTRWGLEPPRESLRLLALAEAAFERLGQKESWRNYIVFREYLRDQPTWGSLDTVLISRKPFLPADIETIKTLRRRTRAPSSFTRHERISPAPLRRDFPETPLSSNETILTTSPTSLTIGHSSSTLSG